MHVAIPYSDNIQDLKTNYYVRWLEEKTGLSLDFTIVHNRRCDDYLAELFNSDSEIDIVLFGEDFIPEEEKIRKYAASGEVYIPEKTTGYTGYGQKELDGAGEIMWINYEWLESLGLSMPKTTDELAAVLRSFKEKDPNGNGIADEIALIGAVGDYSCDPIEFLLESFVYNDPYHSRYGAGRDADKLMASTDEYREGIMYCNDLFNEGLIDERSFYGTSRDICELINSPVALVGAFTTDSISNAVYRGNPEIMARYVHVPPLKGPKGACNALYTLRTTRTAAIITGSSNMKEEAKLLLDTMMTEEASLIARFGEPEVDWTFSSGQDVSIFGTPSTIITKNYIRNTLQNKHLSGIGPMEVPAKYLMGVTWNGINSDTEYIDAEAQISYRYYLPNFGDDEPVFHEYDETLSAYLDRSLKDFVRGKKDVRSDTEWGKYLNGIDTQ